MTAMILKKRFSLKGHLIMTSRKGGIGLVCFLQVYTENKSQKCANFGQLISNYACLRFYDTGPSVKHLTCLCELKIRTGVDKLIFQIRCFTKSIILKWLNALKILNVSSKARPGFLALVQTCYMQHKVEGKKKVRTIRQVFV
jgi:hypothetical protein